MGFPFEIRKLMYVDAIADVGVVNTNIILYNIYQSPPSLHVTFFFHSPYFFPLHFYLFESLSGRLDSTCGRRGESVREKDSLTCLRETPQFPVSIPQSKTDKERNSDDQLAKTNVAII